ncbi:MAG: fibronectin type III domain-containing protein [Candidatus Blackburnbacteria bacterium]|nr:fibronectin type III domain-containing protein [Candidatus Blackburnbacteria bacterium]
MKQQHTFPTFLGLFVLIIGVAIGAFLVQSKQTITSSASPEETPSNVKITNISDKSFTVSWTTTKKVSGFVLYGENQSLGQTADGEAANTHSVDVSSLSPSTAYYFKIVSGQNTYDEKGEAYQVKTGPKLAAPAKNDVVFGTILDTLGKPAPKVLVIASVTGASPLSTQTDAKGTWVIPLSSLRTSTLSRYANYSPKTTLEIFVSGNSKTSLARILVGNARPVPPITLGKNYNFTDVKSPSSTTLPNANIELAAATLPSPTPPISPKVTPTPTIRLTPTPTPTSKPIGGAALLSPTPTRVPTPTPVLNSTLPDVGDLTPMVLLSIMGLSLVSSGFLLAKVIA